MLLTSAQIKPKSFESRRTLFLFFTRGGCVSCLRACLGVGLLPVLSVRTLQSPVDDILPLEEGAGKRCSECDQYPNLSEALTASVDSCVKIKSAPSVA